MNRTKMIKRTALALLIAMLLTAALAPSALASFKATVYTSAKAYNIPSTSGKSINVPEGLTVTVTATSGNWAKVSYKGNTAYMQVSTLNLVNRLTAYTARSTSVYKQPYSSSSQLGTLSIGTKVYVVNKVNGYYRVQNSSGSVTGYIASGDLTTRAKLTAAYNAYRNAQDGSSSSGSSNASRLISLLYSLCGRPYSASATVDSAPGSFNCSTLVCYAMDQFGISMKGTAAEQASDSRFAKITSISDLRVGDVLCFDEDGSGSCSHTAIYIGNGQFVEASQNAGKVHVNALDSWYKEHFMWARRP